MSFPRYPKYKDSGVEWLGQVPEHWRSGSIRWLARRYAGGTPDKSNLSFWENGTVPWINSGAVNDRLISEPSAYITQEALDKSSARWTPAGALVMALAGQGKTKGMVAQLGIRATCNQSMAAIIPGDELNARFLFWWLESNYENIRNLAGGDLRDGLNLELVGNIKCPLPSNPEQTRIAAFLDRETAKIDALVAEQERLIALLKEKRQAVISHAATKGLNPNAPMKPSGIEWLGDVPAHWKIAPLKWHSRCCSGDGLPSDKVDSFEGENKSVQAIGGNGLMGYTVQGNINHSVLAVGRVGALCGNVHIVHPPAWITDNALILDPSRNAFDLQFLALVLRTRNFNDIASKTAQPLITGTQVSDERVPLPPLAEQQEVSVFIGHRTTKFDALTAEAQRAIDLLQERRTALISAAVTGQIDVRKANLIYEPGI